jgi:tetraacyldisaccharide 4'-kinase
MLQAAGLQIDRLPQPDHAAYARPPWPADTADVVTTEKDAVKLPPSWAGSTRVWVVGLDLALPADWVDDLSRYLLASTANPVTKPSPEP